MSVSWKWYVIMSIFIMRVVRVSVMCVCQVREGSGEREDKEIVGDTIGDRFDCFEIRDCENFIRIFGRSCKRGRSAHTSSDVDS